MSRRPRGLSCVPCKPLAAACSSLVLAMIGASAWAQSPGEPAGGGQAHVSKLRQDMRKMIELARDRVFPSLVNIEVVTARYWGGKERKGRSVGSGTIISPDGYVLTNAHVARNGKKFRCTLADKQEITADLVGEDPLTDLAVLKLNTDELSDPGKSLPAATFGDSDELQVGDHVMAMGSPWALSRSVTLGIVSNTERVLVGGDDAMELEAGQRTGLFTLWIQHDASISPGNSGGPLVNLEGEVVGVNTRGNMLGGNMGFATPCNLAKTVFAALVESGEVPRSWIGVSFKPIAKTGFERGVLVNSVVKDGPAGKAGIEAGDVILRINDQPITVRFPEEVPPLLKRISDLPIGSEVAVSYERKEIVANAVIATSKLEKDRGDEAALRAWGLTVMDITAKMARDHRLDSTDGVLISGVRSGGPAQLAEPALQAHDVVRSIDAKPIRDMAGLIATYEEVMESESLPEYLLVEFDRRGKNHLTLLKPKPDEDDDPPREAAKAWIGIATQPVLKKLAKQLGDPEARGFRITRVYPHTNAAQTDLRVGDIVVSLNGENIKPRGMQDAGLLARKIRRLDIGDPAELTVARAGQRRDVSVSLERTRLTIEEARQDRNRDFEMTVRETTFFDRDANRWDESVKGVLINQIESAGWAGLGGLRGGDLIQLIDDRPIRGLKSYRQAMEAVAQEQPERVVFVVLRGVQTRFQYVEPDWSPVVIDEKKAQDQDQ